ncbi:hypothetical protein [Alteromonas sp. 009811495]|uniref:hypothetical protein n=1 Tax=Alteromonas sp. 009811495 TaxID=3002962 RepID=UPI00237E3994|nr:hypothetical protein [Alteromonas sp. 009811495]WDT86985.1 hypothetical protein OZ660_04310 [Alteromonas sp. 009811495]
MNIVNIMNKNNSAFGLFLLVIVFVLGFVGYQTGIPLDALIASIKTFVVCLAIALAAFYIQWLPLTVASVAAGFFWFIEGKGLMLAKANAVGRGQIFITSDANGFNLPWYTTDLFIYFVVIALFGSAYLFYRMEQTSY